MTQQNLISIEFSDEQLLEINNAINTLKTLLLPMLKALRPEERLELAKMGDKTVAFVIKSQEYAIANPEFVPSFLNMEEFRKDVKAVENLTSINASLQQLADLTNDSLLMAGSDAFKGALLFYEIIKAANKTNEPKAGSIYDDLSPRFPAKRKSKTPK